MQPPVWLIEQIAKQARRLYPHGEGDPIAVDDERGEHIARAAYAAGADAELEACCEVVSHWHGDWHKGIHLPTMLRVERRPKPPSLKERLSKAIVEGDESQALKLLEELDDSL